MDMENYYGQLQQTALEGFKRFNNATQVENKKWQLPAGSWDIHVVRGKVLEKATTTRIRLNTKNPATGEQTRFDIFQIKVYPTSPRIPILLFNMENRTSKEDIFAGFLDVAPVAASREDLNFLQDRIRNVTTIHGQDYEALRKKIENIYRMDHWQTALNAAIGIRLELAKEKIALIEEAGLTWLESYFTILEKKAGQPYNKEQEALMDTVRARIMEFYLLKDLSMKVVQQLGLPIDAPALSHFAPTIRY